jgi:alginate O-acetyltransferase complex protein AlgI
VFDSKRAVDGLTLMLYGFFKKLVVADRLAVYVNQVYGDLEHASSISVALACVFFFISDILRF